MSVQTRSVRVRGTQLRVLDVVADGRPIVLAHGVGSSARFLVDAFARPFARAGLRLVAFDLRGHGGSDPARSTREHRLEVHAADLAAIADLVRAELIGGISLGAHAAVVAASGRAAIGTVLACLPAWTGLAVPGEGTHAGVAGAVEQEGIGAMVAGFARDETLEPWLREVLVRDWRAADATSLAAALSALDGGLAPTEAELRSLSARLGVVGWDDDPGHPIEVAEDWARWAPNAALERISIRDLNGDLEAFGRAAVAALERLGAV